MLPRVVERVPPVLKPNSSEVRLLCAPLSALPQPLGAYSAKCFRWLLHFTNLHVSCQTSIGIRIHREAYPLLQVIPPKRLFGTLRCVSYFHFLMIAMSSSFEEFRFSFATWPCLRSFLKILLPSFVSTRNLHGAVFISQFSGRI